MSHPPPVFHPIPNAENEKYNDRNRTQWATRRQGTGYLLILLRVDLMYMRNESPLLPLVAPSVEKEGRYWIPRLKRFVARHWCCYIPPQLCDKVFHNQRM